MAARPLGRAAGVESAQAGLAQPAAPGLNAARLLGAAGLRSSCGHTFQTAGERLTQGLRPTAGDPRPRACSPPVSAH